MRIHPFSASIANPINTREYEISNALHINQSQEGGQYKSEIQPQYSDNTFDDTMFDHLIAQHEYKPQTRTSTNKTRRDKRKKPKTRRPIRKLKMRKTRKPRKTTE